MRFAVVVRVGLASILFGAATARAQGLPTCRVLLVKSPATETVSKTVIQEVKGWVDDSARGSKLVSSLDEADVVLEFNKFGHTMQFDGIPAWRWQFVARRLSEPDRERGTHRFIFVTIPGQDSTTHLKKQMPLILTDVCMGWLPKTASADNAKR
jgi:hypothetical protein